MITLSGLKHICFHISSASIYSNISSSANLSSIDEPLHYTELFEIFLAVGIFLSFIFFTKCKRELEEIPFDSGEAFIFVII